MRKDITIGKILSGGEKMNKSAFDRQYECCFRRLNLEKYKQEKS